MAKLSTFLRCAALLGGIAALSSPALAASFASSASEGVSASVGSISDSIQNASNSSSRTTKDVAEGDYRVIELAEVAGRPGTLRVALQAVDGAARFELLLPRQAAEAGRLAVDGVVHAAERPYGLEFASAAAAGQPFYLALRDDWLGEMQTRVVAL